MDAIKSGFSQLFANFLPWIAVGITVYIALVFGGMPDFCHIVTPAHANDLEEPLSPKEHQEEAIPRKANY